MGTPTKSLEITDQTFQEEVLQSEVPVLVDFGAAWCGPCKIIAPVINELAAEFEGKARLAKLDVDINPATTVKYGVRSLPTLLVFKNGEVVDKIIGAVPKKQIAAMLSSHI